MSAPTLTAEPSHKIGHGRERLQVLYNKGREAAAAGLVSAALLIPAVGLSACCLDPNGRSRRREWALYRPISRGYLGSRVKRPSRHYAGLGGTRFEGAEATPSFIM